MVSGQWSVVRCPSSMVHGPLALVTMIVLTLAAQTVFAAGEGKAGNQLGFKNERERSARGMVALVADTSLWWIKRQGSRYGESVRGRREHSAPFQPRKPVLDHLCLGIAGGQSHRIGRE
jgi:hypothetical protein